MKLIEKVLKPFLSKTFDIRPGEFERALLLQANIFVIITIILILKSVVNALFLSKFGVESLPRVFILIAIFAAVLIFLYSRALNKKSLIKIIHQTYWITILGLILFGALLSFNLLESWVLYLFFIGVSLFAVLAASQFWILANIVLNGREAKRLFGFIGAGAIAGGIFGGYLTSLIAEIFGSEKLLFLCAFGLIFCIPIYNRLWKSHVKQQQTSFQIRGKTKIISDHPVRLLLRSKHLTLLASIVGVSVIVAKLIDYQFSALASAKISDPDELAVFFGFWFSTMNVVSLIIQLFLTKRVVGMYGVGFSLFVLPFAILMPSLLLVFIPQLWVVIMLKVNEGSLKQSLNKSGVELLMLPIPSEVKKQTKTFIDVFIDSLATGIGGLLLLVFATVLELRIEFISLITAILVLVWFYLVWLVRKEYIASFKLKINKEESGSDQSIDFSKQSVVSGLIKVLSKGADNQILFVLGKLKDFSLPSFIDPLRNLLHHQNSRIRAEAIRRLYHYKGQDLVGHIHVMINDIDSDVRVAAFEYILEHSPENIEHIAKPLISSEDYKVRSAAILSVAIETKDNPTLSTMLRLTEVIMESINQLERIEDKAQRKFETIHYLKAVGHLGIPSLFSWIETNMTDSDQEISNAAIESGGDTLNTAFIPRLIELLNSKHHMIEASKSLTGYGVALTANFRALMADEEAINTNRNITSVLEHFDSQEAVMLLFEMVMKGDLNTRSQALKSLNNLKIKYPHLSFDKNKIIVLIYDEAKNYHDTLLTLYTQNEKLLVSSEIQIDARNSLIDLLERRMDGNLERIFHLLGLRYSAEDMQSIYEGIQSNKPDLRMNAIEFLDTLLEVKLKKVLMPLVESTMLEGISKEAIGKLNLDVASQYECFQRLLEGKDLKVKLAVLYLMKLIKDNKYALLAANYKNDKNVKVRDFASQVVANHERLARS